MPVAEKERGTKALDRIREGAVKTAQIATGVRRRRTEGGMDDEEGLRDVSGENTAKVEHIEEMGMKDKQGYAAKLQDGTVGGF